MNEKLKAKAAKLKSDIPALWLALKSPQTPIAAKILAGLCVAYALSPIDLIPDFIPGLGLLDDLILLPCLAAAAIKLIPGEVFDQCREQTEGLWNGGKPKKWYYALPVVVFWALLVLLVVKAIRH